MEREHPFRARIIRRKYDRFARIGFSISMSLVIKEIPYIYNTEMERSVVERHRGKPGDAHRHAMLHCFVRICDTFQQYACLTATIASSF